MTRVYIDGFNLYNGLAAPLGCKWVDLNLLFERLTGDPVDKIWFFTALVSGPRVRNQNTYLAALATLPNVQVVEGHFKKKSASCRVSSCPLGCENPSCEIACSSNTCEYSSRLSQKSSRRFQTREEKHTDVNIALQMLDDAYQGLADRMVVVSGDSDLSPALLKVKQRFPQIEILLSVPCLGPTDPRRLATELREASDSLLPIPLDLFVGSQFAPLVRKQNGKTIKIPLDWTIAKTEDIPLAIAEMERRRSLRPNGG